MSLIDFVKRYYYSEIEKVTLERIQRGTAPDFARHQSEQIIANRRRKEYADKSGG